MILALIPNINFYFFSIGYNGSDRLLFDGIRGFENSMPVAGIKLEDRF